MVGLLDQRFWKIRSGSWIPSPDVVQRTLENSQHAKMYPVQALSGNKGWDSGRMLCKTAKQTRWGLEDREWMDGREPREVMVTFSCVGLPIPLSTSASGPFLRYRALSSKMSWTRRGLVGLVRWASRGMLHSLAARRPTLSIVSQHLAGPPGASQSQLPAADLRCHSLTLTIPLCGAAISRA